MKQIGKNFEKDGSGYVRLIPEEPEDMWHLYNLINAEDIIEGLAYRKVVTETATGSTDSTRVKTVLAINVESVDFDTSACMLRVRGRNVRENEHVKLGAYHTLDIEMNRKLKLTKHEWDAIHLERLQQACDPTLNAEVAVVVMQEGIAHVCLITSAMTLVRAKIDMQIPRKRKGLCSQHEKGMNRFFDTIMRAVKQHVNFEVVKCIVLASPGFVKDHFFEYLMSANDKQDMKVFIENKAKFVLAHSSSGFKAAVKEVLQDAKIQGRLADTKAAGEVKALNQFYEMMHVDQDRAVYGPKHIEKALEAQGVGTLLITDTLFRCNDVAERRRYVKMVEQTRDSGGDVKIFSSSHASGEGLDLLTGVAAILRFPMPEIANTDVGDDSDSD